jgi:hypothetical protein
MIENKKTKDREQELSAIGKKLSDQDQSESSTFELTDNFCKKRLSSADMKKQ